MYYLEDFLNARCCSKLFFPVLASCLNSSLLNGLPLWLSGKESICNSGDAGRLGFDPWSRNQIPHTTTKTQSSPINTLGIPGGSMLKNLLASAGDRRQETWVWWGRFPGGGNGNPLQYFCQENPMDRGAWWAQSVGSQRVGHGWVSTRRAPTDSV